MKVGDLVQSVNRYRGHTFLVVEARQAGRTSVVSVSGKQIRAISLKDGTKTRWGSIEYWKVISESR